MSDVAIVSACYGGYDTPRSQAAQDIDVDWLYFTDGDPAPEPWVTVKGIGTAEDPRMSAKWFKCVPPVSQRQAIWIDANMEVTSPAFAREALTAIHDGIAVWKHPRRDCIYEEAEASIGAESQGGKYDAVEIMAQVGDYRAEGHPEHGGLYACGTVAWDLATVGKLGADWLHECERRTPQDQLSLPVVCRRAGVTPGVFPYPQIQKWRDGYLSNRWLRIWPHAR